MKNGMLTGEIVPRAITDKFNREDDDTNALVEVLTSLQIEKEKREKEGGKLNA